MGLVVAIILILLLFGGGGYYGHSAGYFGTGYAGIGGFSIVGLLLLVFVIWLLSGHA